MVGKLLSFISKNFTEDLGGGFAGASIYNTKKPVFFGSKNGRNYRTPPLYNTTPPTINIPPIINMPPPPYNAPGVIGKTAFLSQVAMGAVTGGATSYYTGGSFSQGAVAGAFVGAGMGAFAGSGLVSGAASKAAFSIPSQASTYVHRAVSGFENAAYRRYAIGAGAALGGFTFGGQRNHKRGFNRDRGNTIRR